MNLRMMGSKPITLTAWLHRIVERVDLDVSKPNALLYYNTPFCYCQVLILRYNLISSGVYNFSNPAQLVYLAKMLKC